MKIFTRRIRSMEAQDARKAARELLDYVNSMQDDIERMATSIEKELETLKKLTEGQGKS